MQIFSVRPFKGTDSIIDSSKLAVRVPRRSLHPGVAARLITDALADTTGTGVDFIPNKTAFEYKRGSHYHMWFLTTDQVQVLEQYLDKMTSDELSAKVKSIRAELPKKSGFVTIEMTTASTPVSYADDGSGSDEESDDDDDDDADEPSDFTQYGSDGGEG